MKKLQLILIICILAFGLTGTAYAEKTGSQGADKGKKTTIIVDQRENFTRHDDES